MFSTLFDNILLGLSAALTVNNLLYCALGVTLGTVVGVLPGIGALATISMLIPITFHLDPLAALVMVSGIYYGSSYGGSVASILLNLPGSATNAVTCLDGYPMAQQGRAGVALFMTTVGSFFGASVGIIIMMLFSPVVVEVGLSLRSPEYFSLILLALIASSVITVGSPIKGIAMVVLGVFFGIVGTDIYTGVGRYTYGITDLAGGFSMAALAMGVFGVAEVVSSIWGVKSGKQIKSQEITFRSMLPTRDDMRRSWMPMVRGSAIGSFIGALPGTGSTIAAFISYAVEKKAAKDPDRFGKGAIEGIMAPETANNAADQTAFIPTLTLGIPGTVTMALILVVLLIHGITPGPTMVTQHPEVFWGVVMSFWIGNLMLFILNAPMIGVWVRLLLIPYHILYPAIMMFVCIGVYSINYSTFDVLAVMGFGILGYFMRLTAFPGAALLLGFVLGPMLEEYFRRAMVTSRGSFAIFVERPISLGFLLLTAVLVIWSLWGAIRTHQKQKAASQSA